MRKNVGEMLDYGCTAVCVEGLFRQQERRGMQTIGTHPTETLLAWGCNVRVGEKAVEVVHNVPPVCDLSKQVLEVGPRNLRRRVLHVVAEDDGAVAEVA